MHSHINKTAVVCILLCVLTSVFQIAIADPTANKALVERRIDLWDTGDLTIADEIFSVDFVPHVPHYPQVTDVESYKAEVVNTRTAFPDFYTEVHSLVAEGDKVACRFTNHYTGPAGNPVTATGITIDRLENDKIVEEWWSVDMLGVMEQLGMAPQTRQDYIWGTPSPVAGDPGDPQANQALVQQLFEQVFQGNLEVIDELLDSDHLFHDPLSPFEVRGPEAYKQHFAMYPAAFPDIQMVIEDMFAQEDMVAVRWTLTGTHQGDLMGIPPTGRSMAMEGINLYRVADGKLVETWPSYDALGMMQQLTTPEWPVEGTWIINVPTSLGNMILAGSLTAQDTDKTRFTGAYRQISSVPVLIDVFPDMEQVTFAGGLVTKTGLNTYEMTMFEYFTKATDPGLVEIVGIGICTSAFKLVDQDLVQGSGNGAYYTADQDLDLDGFPDEEQEPIVCLPWQWTGKRLTAMPGCVRESSLK